MALAFVLVNCRLGSAKVVLDELKQITEVTQASAISGAYDIIVRVEANTVGHVKGVVMKIRRIEGVSSSVTLIKAD